MSAPRITFRFLRTSRLADMPAYQDTARYPVTTTWQTVKAEQAGVVRAIRREWDAYAWPGGYPIYYITGDNGVLCPRCANKNLRLTLDASDKQWHIVAADVNYEDDSLYCDNCYGRIESAYGGE